MARSSRRLNSPVYPFPYCFALFSVAGEIRREIVGFVRFSRFIRLNCISCSSVIAGLSYELLQFTGRHDGTCVRALSMPGILLQKLTTKEPTDDMVEVAIIAVKAVLPSHEDPSVPVDYWVGRVTPAGEYIKDEEATEKYRVL